MNKNLKQSGLDDGVSILTLCQLAEKFLVSDKVERIDLSGSTEANNSSSISKSNLTYDLKKYVQELAALIPECISLQAYSDNDFGTLSSNCTQSESIHLKITPIPDHTQKRQRRILTNLDLENLCSHIDSRLKLPWNSKSDLPCDVKKEPSTDIFNSPIININCSYDSISSVIDEIKERSRHSDSVIMAYTTQSKKACKILLDVQLPEPLTEALSNKFKNDVTINPILYAHQVTAIKLAVEYNADLILSTSTSSGKSLVHYTVILSSILKNHNNCSLLIFPSKALAQDQYRSWKKFLLFIPKETVCERCKAQNSKKCPLATSNILDGDTVHGKRMSMSKTSTVLFINPDILHAYLLLHREKTFKRFFDNLSVLTIDEGHTYTGIFGSQVALVFRRLFRLIDVTTLKILYSSATIGNPIEHFQKLFGITYDKVYTDSTSDMTQIPKPEYKMRILCYISQDYSPMGKQHFVLWQPPSKVGPTDEPLKYIQSDFSVESLSLPSSDRKNAPTPFLECSLLLATLVSLNYKVITFCTCRSIVELLLSYVRKFLRLWGRSHMIPQIVSYRAGYPASKRRSLEQQMFGGLVKGIICTNALELGINIGCLNVAILMGYPGSTISLKQQIGRIGRTESESLAILIGFQSAYDNYVISQKERLLHREPEQATINPQNDTLVMHHLVCAAAEGNRTLTLKDVLQISSKNSYDEFVRTIMETLESSFTIIKLDSTDSCEWKLGSVKILNQRIVYPHKPNINKNHVLGIKDKQIYQYVKFAHPYLSLRSPDTEKIYILLSVDETKRVPELIENLKNELQPKNKNLEPKKPDYVVIDSYEYSKAFFALYPGAIYQNTGYEFIIKELDLKENFAIATLTKSNYYTKIRDIQQITIISNPWSEALSSINVIECGPVRVVKNFLGYRKIDKKTKKVLDTLPLDLPPIIKLTQGLWFKCFKKSLQGLHGVSHLMHSVCISLVICDQSDLACYCINEYENADMNQKALIFEAKFGSLGILEKAFQMRSKLLSEMLYRIQHCQCQQGCYTCVYNAQCTEHNRAISKRDAESIIVSICSYVDLISNK